MVKLKAAEVFAHPDEYVDNPQAPVIFADGFAGILTHDGCVRINLIFIQGAAPGTEEPIQRIISGRLVLPVGTFARFAHTLNAVYVRGVEQGFYPAVEDEPSSDDEASEAPEANDESREREAKE